MHLDVAVLGAGPGGYVAAIRAAQLGRRVGVIEVRHWGGVCLNLGCVPVRALLRNAEIAHVVNHRAASFGISGDVALDYGVASDRSRQVADGRVKGVHYLMRKNGITEVDGWGTFRDDHTIEVALTAGGTETVTFDSAVIATGSTVRTLPGLELSANVGTYESLVMARTLPRSIVIVGAGAIGMELGYVLNSYGADVTVIELMDRVLPTEDLEVSKEIARQYRKQGIAVLTSTGVDAVVDDGAAVTITCRAPASPGDAITLRAQKLLIAIGFAPRTTGYGLENTGIALTDRGAIAVDEVLRTSVPHIHAVGDVTAKLQRAHVAEAQGVVAAETIARAETVPLGDYRMLPRGTFCQPEIASFGLTEQQARDEGHDVRVARFPLTANAKAHALGEPAGFAKLVADKSGAMLGAHLIGPDVSELLPALTLAHRQGLTADELARNVHVHPTISEALQEGYHGLLGHMINL